MENCSYQSQIHNNSQIMRCGTKSKSLAAKDHATVVKLPTILVPS